MKRNFLLVFIFSIVFGIYHTFPEGGKSDVLPFKDIKRVKKQEKKLGVEFYEKERRELNRSISSFSKIYSSYRPKGKDNKEVSTIVEQLIDCISRDICSQFDEKMRYQDPDNGIYHRGLAENLDRLKNELDQGNDIFLSRDDAVDALSINNSEVQIAAAMLIISSGDGESINALYKDCSKIRSDILFTYLKLISGSDLVNNDERLRLRNKCFRDVMSSTDSIAQTEFLSYASHYEVPVEVLKDSTSHFCPLQKSGDESELVLFWHYTSVLDKYNISCEL